MASGVSEKLTPALLLQDGDGVGALATDGPEAAEAEDEAKEVQHCTSLAAARMLYF
jgi:hypothetical protein